ncbi:MAG: putative toxin-antitoxin system toxin component, PIN family [Candidatus Omnitrophica bacterium]|nr:putative toxin-antitoxin system toxin component, PIN family [Candidatus Omnitrophota bacterium]MBU1134727.1 putative toxin-antitoxin system toxin component, PIN family [Candidatus Omnitrophota bacterium]
MIKAVVDTNVVVSGLLGVGSCREIYLRFKDNKFILITSNPLFEEFITVLGREKFKNLIAEEDSKRAIYFIQTKAIFINPQQKVFNSKSDPKDNIVLEATLEAKPNCLVSGDKHILTFKPKYKGTPVLTAAEFIALLDKSKGEK